MALKTTKHHVLLACNYLLMIFAFTMSIVSVQSQQVSHFSPSLAEIGCVPAPSYCIYDGSREGRLFVYVPQSAQLWVYHADGSPAEHYDLMPFQSEIGGTSALDFVAISDTEILFSDSQYESDVLTIYSTETRQIHKPLIDFGNIILSDCDALLGSTPLDNLYAFPNSSRVMFCVIIGDQRQLVILDLSQEIVEQVIDIPAQAGSPGLLPWHKVLMGLDGKIYIQSPRVFRNQDVRDMFATVNRPLLQDEAVQILRFDPQGATWTLIQLPFALLTIAPESGLGSISELAGVDEAGNLYYWDKVFIQNQNPMPLLTVFNSEGYFLTQVDSQTLLNAGAKTYLYQSGTADIVFLNGESGLASINPVNFLPMLTPTLSPTDTP